MPSKSRMVSTYGYMELSIIVVYAMVTTSLRRITRATKRPKPKIKNSFRRRKKSGKITSLFTNMFLIMRYHLV
jgi:hypothetical protein